MEKTEAVNKLIALGYDARLENSAVIVYHTREEKITLNKIKEELTKLGYDASFGIRGKKRSEATETATPAHNYVESDGGQIGFDFSDFE